MEFKEFHGIKGSFFVDSTKLGPKVVIFGGTHGDEVSGVRAIERLISDFESNKYLLLQGSLVLVYANEEAIKVGRRYLRFNLNRLFKDSYDADIDESTYEYKRAQELKSILKDCDYLLDLHSAPIAQEPFLICEADLAHFFRRLGLKKIITGWSKFSNGVIGGDTENYANVHGALAATLEAGNHNDLESVEVAYQAVLTMLASLKMIEIPRSEDVKFEVFDMYHLQTKDFKDFHYVPEVENFLYVPKNEAYAFQNNQPLLAAEDSYLLIPMKPEDTHIGEEVCYLGRKVETGLIQP